MSNTTPELLRKDAAARGRIGGLSGSRKDKKRAGHARSAQMFRQMARIAVEKGDQVQAADLFKRAERQERLAK